MSWCHTTSSTIFPSQPSGGTFRREFTEYSTTEHFTRSNSTTPSFGNSQFPSFFDEPWPPSGFTARKDREPAEDSGAVKALTEQNTLLQAENSRLEKSLMAMKSSVETVRWEKERLARENVALSEKHLRELDDARQHVRRANMDADRWRGSQDGGLRSSQRQIEELQHKLAEMQERLQAAHRQTETAKNDKADLARQHQTALDAASRQGIQLQDQNQRAERELAEARERIASMELERKRQQEHNDNISSAFEQHLLECESHVCQLPESTNVVPEYETIPAEGSRAFQTELIVTEPSAATMARFLTLSSDRNGAVKKECLPLLFKLFTSEIPHIQLWAIEGFAQLLVSAVYRKPAFEMDCIPALAAVLLSTSSDVLYYALLALERLLTTESEASKVFCHSQTVHLIAGMLSSDGRVGPKAADVVYEVLGWEFGMSLLDESGALPALRTFVGSGSSVQNECVKKIAKKLAKFDRI